MKSFELKYSYQYLIIIAEEVDGWSGEACGLVRFRVGPTAARDV